MPQIHYTRFPVTSPVDGEAANLLRTCWCCGLFSDTANKSAKSWQQVVVVEFGKRHDTTDITDFCPHQLVTDLSFMLRICCRLARGKSPTCHGLSCYGETGVMDFCLNRAASIHFRGGDEGPEWISEERCLGTVRCPQSEGPGAGNF